MADRLKTFENLMRHQKVVYVTSLDETGHPCVKAMFNSKVEDAKTVYFSTNTSSARVAHYRRDPRASVYYCDRRFFRGLMLRGTMEVLEDLEHKKMLWKPTDIQYYPKGVEDPDYCVLRFTATSGNYYHGLKNEDFVCQKSEL